MHPFYKTLSSPPIFPKPEVAINQRSGEVAPAVPNDNVADLPNGPAPCKNVITAPIEAVAADSYKFADYSVRPLGFRASEEILKAFAGQDTPVFRTWD